MTSEHVTVLVPLNHQIMNAQNHISIENHRLPGDPEFCSCATRSKCGPNAWPKNHVFPVNGAHTFHPSNRAHSTTKTYFAKTSSNPAFFASPRSAKAQVFSRLAKLPTIPHSLAPLTFPVHSYWINPRDKVKIQIPITPAVSLDSCP